MKLAAAFAFAVLAAACPQTPADTRCASDKDCGDGAVCDEATALCVEPAGEGEGEGDGACTAAAALPAGTGLALADDATLTHDLGPAPPDCSALGGGDPWLVSLRVLAAGAPSTWDGVVAGVQLNDANGDPPKSACDTQPFTVDLQGNPCDGSVDCVVTCGVCYAQPSTDLAVQVTDGAGDVSGAVCVAVP